MKLDNNTIEKCIQIVKSLVRDNCSDHTPYYGACVSCGRYANFEVLDPDDVLEALEEIKSQDVETPRQN